MAPSGSRRSFSCPNVEVEEAFEYVQNVKDTLKLMNDGRTFSKVPEDHGRLQERTVGYHRCYSTVQVYLQSLSSFDSWVQKIPSGKYSISDQCDSSTCSLT
ncbi:hypothetical protein MPTK1_6g06860 [Marchantia polymorpha subsp. ruderalis]|nr:hypothetical protein MARPO_0053s0001 [Marchantia polymorpha]PTQ38043.1 hypothetical protein MARPO_0053s0001 [Marchantia polymorpha]BBN13841.1 hypothetical protein Mp_6g06860 [Marchantia polymorpha subsp. ruderalis]BBN13842.1 hypothetical protein Mp_6g06860 [Marchantia polymorpha subsp. ruderalis]|eukprot:PTQ38042.1 hypothetical protein MARPO_0053s0001 [Marchantia polymorpha]